VKDFFPEKPRIGECDEFAHRAPAHRERALRIGQVRPTRFILRFAIAAVAVLSAASAARAQLPQARLYSIFPCGGKAGTTIELTLTNFADLDGVDRLVFNTPGITAVPKLQTVGGQKKPVANVFEVTIRPDVPTGVYEVYAGGYYGLSNPRIFVVGGQDEAREAEPNNDLEKANELVPGRIVNGTSGGATDVDFYRFPGKRGQRIVATCRAADLDSRMSPVVELLTVDGRRLGYARAELRHDAMVDAVLPEDGTYFIKVHDFLFRGGPEYVYRLSAGVLPYIDYVMPPAGVAGITGHFTLIGRNLPGGRPSDVTIEGRPLEKLDVAIPLPSVAPLAPSQTTLAPVSAGTRIVSWTLKTAAGESNPVLIQLAPSVPILEREPNDTPALATPVSAPGEFAGRFQSPGDSDYYSFHADAGQVFYIEVFAERIGSLADPYLVVDQVGKDAKGAESVTRMTSLDDENTNVAPALFDTRSDDPTYRFQSPETGLYRILLRDRSFESRGDPRLVYHVSIRPEEPDFRLVVLPQYPKQGTIKDVSTWALGLRKGDSREAPILVLRRDGFREPIEVWAEGLPEGVHCRGAAIAANAKTAELILTADENAAAGHSLIRVFGKARVAKKGRFKEVKTETEIVHQAIPATIVWSAETDAPAVSRIGETLALSVMNEVAPFELSTNVVRVEVNQSRQILLPLTISRRNGFDGDVAMALVGANPDTLGLTLKAFPKGKSAELVRCFIPRNERPGTVTLYWKLQAPVAYRRNLEAFERAKTEQATAAGEASTLAATLKKAQSDLDQASRNLGQPADGLKQAKAKLAAAAKMPAAARNAALQDVAKLDAALKSATLARQAAAARLAEAAARSKAAAAAKASADRELAEATKASAPQQLVDFPMSTPIMLTVKPAPLELKTNVPGGGSLKKGGQISVKVDLKRRRGFAGPVTLALPLPPGVKGIAAKPITIAASKTFADFVITADASAQSGALANLVIRAEADFQGKAEVDAPISLKIVP
jgi:hypothetical protein